MTGNHVFLYVEDDALNREAVDLILRRVLGIETLFIFETSAGFMDALKALPQQPDVILFDTYMRPLSGFDLLRMLREDPDYRDAKIIALTTNVSDDDLAVLKEQDFDGTIAEPINLSTFASSIASILNGEPVWAISG